MKKFKCILALLLTFLIIYFLQVNVFTWLNIRGIMPNLFVILVLFIGLFAGQKLGVLFGLLFGLILDLLVGKSIGFSSIFLAIIGYLGEYFDKNYSKDNRILLIILAVLCTSIYEIGMHAVDVIKIKASLELPAFLGTLLVENLYNVLIVIIIYPLMKKFGSYVERTFKEKDITTRYF